MLHQILICTVNGVQGGKTVRAQAYDLEDLGSSPCCAIDFLCDLGHVFLGLNSPSVKLGGRRVTALSCRGVVRINTFKIVKRSNNMDDGDVTLQGAIQTSGRALFVL